MRSVCLLMCIGMAASPAAATEQEARAHGAISGVVIDAKTGEAIIEAQVTVVQTGERVLTDLDGNYRLALPPGTYDLRVFAELRPARRIATIAVEPGKTTRIDVQLGGGDDEKIAVQEVVVVARPDTATEAVQIVRRQKAAVVQDGVSAEQIARTPDSNAGEAVKRVVAATVQDGKYVVVRGLGGRYSNTLLNGVALPSADPDNPSAPLDLFPATLLANLTVSKTFNADIPGNFAGGSLQIETREFPNRFVLKLKMAASGDTATTFADTTASIGGGLDFLGFDDGLRALPDRVPQDGPLVPRGGMTRAQVDAAGRSFPLTWRTKPVSSVPNASFAGTVGDTIAPADGQRLGYLATLNYAHKWTRRSIDAASLYTDGTLSERSHTAWGQESANLGGLVNIGWSLSAGHRLGLVSLYTHANDNAAQVTDGTIAYINSQVGRKTRIRFATRDLLFNQVTGDHALSPRLTLAWQGNLSVTGQDEPDLRDLLYLKSSDGLYRFQNQAQSGDRTYNDLTDVSGGGGADLALQLGGIKAKAGASAQLTKRRFDARRFRFNARDADLMQLALPADELFAPENLGTIAHLDEVTRVDDSYDFKRSVLAGYALADVTALDPVRIVAGARVEAAIQRLLAGSKFTDPPSMADPVDRTDVNVLPSVNLVYALADGMNLRASYSLTVARPQIRELAPYVFFDSIRSRAISGNPDLRTTTIHNADLRWELFLGGTELVAASAFFKQFRDPIETVIVNDQNDVGYRNGTAARSFGGEVEVRLSGARVAPELADLWVAGNLALVFSRIDFDPNDPTLNNQTNRERPLQGQSPYVANVELGYRVPAWGTEISVLYNVFGPRIAEVGILGLPDVKEQPLHRVDVNLSQRIEESLLLKLSCTNLLDGRVSFKQGATEVFGYDPGVAILGSIEWTYDRGKE